MSNRKKTLKQTIIEKLVNASPSTFVNELKDPAVLATLLNSDEELSDEEEEKYKNSRIYESTSYLINGKKYNYLNEETLHKDFQLTLDEKKTENPFHISLCMFKINQSCKEPFLQFFVRLEEKNNENYMVFPSIELTNSDFEFDTSMEDNDTQSIFENYCFKQFKELTGVTYDVARKAYRGYVEEYDNTIYPIFDCTYIDLVPQKNELWGIMDELLNEQYIHEYIIEKNIFVMFNNNEYLSYIKDEKNERINLPCCLYLVKKTDDDSDYENVFIKNDEDEQTISMIDGKINHEVFGLNYYFTTDPIDVERDGRLKRFAAFVNDSLYFLNINIPIADIDLDGDADDADDNENVKTYKDYSSIYFFENYKQLWCIKDITRFTPM